MTTTPRIPSPSRLLAACTVTVMALTGCSGPADTTGDQSPAASPSASPTPPKTWADGAHVAWSLDLGQAPTAGSGFSPQWRVGTPETNHPALVQDTDEQVIIAAGNHISAYDPTTGQSTWSTTVTPAGKRAACAGGVVKERLWCISGVIDTATGEVAMTPPAGQYPEVTFAATKSAVIRMEFDGQGGPANYTAFDPVSGTELWQVTSENSMAIDPATDFVVVNDQVMNAVTGETVSSLEVPQVEGEYVSSFLYSLPDGTAALVVQGQGLTKRDLTPVEAAGTVLDAAGQPMTPLTTTSEYLSLMPCGSSEAALAVLADPANTECFRGPGGEAVTGGETMTTSREILDATGHFDVVAYDPTADVAIYFTYFFPEAGTTAALVAHEGFSTVDISTWEVEDYAAFQQLPEVWRSEEMQTATTDSATAPTGTAVLQSSTAGNYDVDHFYTITYSVETMVVQRWEPGAES